MRAADRNGNSAQRACADAFVNVRDRYRALRSRVDLDVSDLVRVHRPRMQCAAGCAACCTRLSVLPVERYIVRAAIGDCAASGASQRVMRSAPPPNPCGFLRDGECTIYCDRPLVCRVHGLPLRYRVVSYDDNGVPSDDARNSSDDARNSSTRIDERESAYLTVWCDLNFTGQNPERPTFTDGEFFDMNALNTELEALNAAFLRTFVGRRFVGRFGVFLCDDSV